MAINKPNTPIRRSSGLFTNDLGKYIEANKPIAGQMADDISQPIEKEEADAQNEFQQDTDQQRQAVQAGTGLEGPESENEGTSYADLLSHRALSGDTLNDSDYEKARKIRENDYTGPQNYTRSDSAYNKAAKAESLAKLTGTSGGLQEVLNNQYGGMGNYSAGTNLFDRSLLQTDEGARGRLSALRNIIGSYDTAEGGAKNEFQGTEEQPGLIGQSKNRLANASSQFVPAINTAIEGKNTELNQRVGTAQQGQTTAYSDLQNLINGSGDYLGDTAQERAAFGLNHAIPNVFKTDSLQADVNHGATVGLSNVANEQDLASLIALNRLKGITGEDDINNAIGIGELNPNYEKPSFNAGGFKTLVDRLASDRDLREVIAPFASILGQNAQNNLNTQIDFINQDYLPKYDFNGAKASLAKYMNALTGGTNNITGLDDETRAALGTIQGFIAQAENYSRQTGNAPNASLVGTNAGIALNKIATIVRNKVLYDRLNSYVGQYNTGIDRLGNYNVGYPELNLGLNKLNLPDTFSTPSVNEFTESQSGLIDEYLKLKDINPDKLYNLLFLGNDAGNLATGQYDSNWKNLSNTVDYDPLHAANTINQPPTSGGQPGEPPTSSEGDHGIPPFTYPDPYNPGDAPSIVPPWLNDQRTDFQNHYAPFAAGFNEESVPGIGLTDAQIHRNAELLFNPAAHGGLTNSTIYQFMNNLETAGFQRDEPNMQTLYQWLQAYNLSRATQRPAPPITSLIQSAISNLASRATNQYERTHTAIPITPAPADPNAPNLGQTTDPTTGRTFNVRGQI